MGKPVATGYSRGKEGYYLRPQVAKEKIVKCCCRSQRTYQDSYLAALQTNKDNRLGKNCVWAKCIGNSGGFG